MTTGREAVLASVDALTEQMTGLLVELVRTPSVGGTLVENAIQLALADRMRALGLDVDVWRIPLDELTARDGFPGMEVAREEAHGVVGVLRGTGGGRSLMFNGHVDVVPEGERATWRDDPFSGIVREGKLYGRGSCDMKAGLIAAWWAVAGLAASGVRLRGDVLLAPVQGEEDGGLGTYALLERGWRADACVIPEPTSLDVVPANAGALTFRLVVPGRATHASRRLEGVSAIEKLWPVWRALEDLERRRNAGADARLARWELPYPLAIGTVRSGSWASSVPDLLVAEGRLGVALGESVAQAREALEAAVAQACAADAWLREHPVTVEWWGGQFASGALPADSDLAERVSDAHAAVTGTRPGVWAAPYGSDLRLLTAAGVPTVQYGPGDAALAHGPDECVALDEVASAARALALLALDIAG